MKFWEPLPLTHFDILSAKIPRKLGLLPLYGSLRWHPSQLVETLPEELRLGLFKSITATDRTDLQMERGKFGVPTVIQNRVRRLSAGSDLRQIKVVIADVVLSEVEAESALSIMKLSHAGTLARLGPHLGRLRIETRSPPWERSCQELGRR